MSGVVGTIGKVLVSPVAAALGAFNGPKQPRQAIPLPTATPRVNSVLSDALSRRRGSQDNRRTGSGGAESRTTAKKTLLGS